MTTRLLLYACSAIVGRVTDSQTCEIWALHPKDPADPTRLIPIDLRRSPSAERDLGAVVIDDHEDQDGATTIGRTFFAGELVGAAYLAEPTFAAHRKDILWPPMRPPALPDYLFQAIVERLDGGKLRRYHGFHAIVERRSSEPGVPTEVTIEDTRGAADAIKVSLDLRDAAVCDPVKNSLSQVGPDSPEGAAGALFLSWDTANKLDRHFPKLPPGLGDRPFPRQGG